MTHLQIDRRSLLAGAAAMIPAASLSAFAQNTQQPQVVLFNNVRVFDGNGTALSTPTNVLVRGNRIERISAAPIAIDRSANTTVVSGNGRTLMPGLIDMHSHIMWESIPQAQMAVSDFACLNLMAARWAEKTLMRGFTTLRDVGGPSFSLKKVIDDGVYAGPRIYPSGALISQTSGHGDFRMLSALPREPGAPLDYGERMGMNAIADGADEVLRKTRENLMRGASQIKLMAGGGVASNYDPLDVTQYLEREIRAAVEAAETWGTYVTVHAYTPAAMQAAIRAGVKCIEHGQLMDEATARIMAEKGIWLSLQPFLDDADAIPFPEGSINRFKQLQMVKGTETAYALAKKYKIKTAFGTDSQFDAKLASRQDALLVKLTKWYTPAEVLKMATADNAELLTLSGPRNPYPGKLGVIEEGALADLLLVDGDPLANIKLIEDPEKNFLIIMKDGKIYKNIVPN
jgi:imidazolonepropionase-like amidohydrolase